MTTRKKRHSDEALTFLENLTGGPLTLSEFIRAIRLGEEMSQIEFAKLLKISKSHLCDIEKNRKTVSPRRAAYFAKKLGYSQEQFVRLALEAILKESGIKMNVAVEAI